MRIGTWNCCRGPLAKKGPLLRQLSPDLAILQECGRPKADVPGCLWSGDNPKQGIGVLAGDRWNLRPVPPRSNTPRCLVPVEVTGPREFLLLVVWAKRNELHPYVEGVVRNVEIYRDLILAQPCVLAADLNSNAIWDHEHPADRNHSALVRALSDLGLVSPYHTFHEENHWAESRPTHYFRWQRNSTFHIDYCFVPVDWAKDIRDVHVVSSSATSLRSAEILSGDQAAALENAVGNAFSRTSMTADIAARPRSVTRQRRVRGILAM